MVSNVQDYGLQRTDFSFPRDIPAAGYLVNCDFSLVHLREKERERERERGYHANNVGGGCNVYRNNKSIKIINFQLIKVLTIILNRCMFPLPFNQWVSQLFEIGCS